MRLKPRIPGARLFRAAARHEANYYQPLIDGGRTIGARFRTIAQGQPLTRPVQPPEPLQIGRSTGWYYLCTTLGIVGLAVAGVTQGDAWSVSLVPIAAVPAILAWGGLRRKR